MSVLSPTEVIPAALQTEKNKPHFLLPQLWIARVALFMERLAWNNRDNLKKLGIDINKLPYWKRYQLLKSERRGLPTNEKGSWESTFFIIGKDEESVVKARHTFAGSMIWEMTKGFVGDKAVLSQDLEIKTGAEGKVSECLPKLTKREWPMTVRILKQGIDGKPVGFVDMVFENKGENPFLDIEWDKITLNDETYIESLRGNATISQTRSLDDWYVEGNVSDKYGSFYRPDIVIGQNIDDFVVHQMTSDRRPLLTIGLEKIEGRVGGVTIGTQNHLPFNGMDMMGMTKNVLDPNMRDSAFEAAVKNSLLLELVDQSGECEDLEKYKKNWNDHRPKTRGVFSFLAKRYRAKDETGLDQRTQIEYFLTFGSFEEQVMAQLANLVDAQKVAHSRELPKDLAKWLVEIPKKIKKLGKHKISGITLLNIAMYMSEYEAQGFAIGPNMMDAIRGELGYESVGSRLLERTDKAKRVVGGDINIEKVHKYTEQLRAISRVRDTVIGTSDIKRQKEDLEKFIKLSNIPRDAQDVIAQSYALEILDQYKIELVAAKRKPSISEWEQEEGLVPEGGLLKLLYKQTHYFTALRELCLKEESFDLETLSEWSANLLNLADPIDHFGLTRGEMIAIIENVSRDYFESEITVLENGVDWGSKERSVILNRLEIVERILGDRAISKFEKEGIKYLVMHRERVLKTLDEIGVLGTTEELTEQVGLIADIAREIELDPAKAVSSVKDRLGVMAGLEKAGLLGAAGLIADSRPMQNASKMVVKCPPGFEVVFQTALAGSHTTVGVGQVNNTLSRKEALDNPMEAFEVVLPYIRANPDIGRELVMYMERTQAKNIEVELVRRMLEGEEYRTFADHYHKGEKGGIGSEIWGEEYILRKKAAAINMMNRMKLQRESRILIKHFNALLLHAISSGTLLTQDGPRLLKELMGGGYRRMWETMNEYKLANIQTNLAQIALVLGFYIKANGNDPTDDEMLLSLREIQKRELERQNKMMIEMKKAFTVGGEGELIWE